MANDTNDEVLRFATRYGLAVKQLDSRYHIPGSNGYIMQEEKTLPVAYVRESCTSATGSALKRNFSFRTATA